MADDSGAQTEITEPTPGRFHLAVIWQGQRFDCGSYLTRPAALTAARLFISRKEGEQAGQKKRPRRKG